MYFATHLAPNVMIGPTISSGVLLNPSNSREYVTRSGKMRRKLHINKRCLGP